MVPKRVLILSIVLLVVAAACNAAPAASPTTAPTADATPAVQAPTEPEKPALAQTVTSDNGVTVSYPDGWLEPLATVGVFLFNNADGQAILNSIRGKPGGLAFQINWQPAQEGQTPQEAFDFLMGSLITGMGITGSEPETITVDGVDVIKVTGANTSPGSEIGLYAALKPAGDGYITFLTYLDGTEIEQHTPLIEAILASTSYTPPA